MTSLCKCPSASATLSRKCFSTSQMKMSKVKYVDFVISGGGMVGMALACALSEIFIFYRNFSIIVTLSLSLLFLCFKCFM